MSFVSIQEPATPVQTYNAQRGLVKLTEFENWPVASRLLPEEVGVAKRV